MAIKITKLSPFAETIFTAKCRRCGTEIEFNYQAIIHDKVKCFGSYVYSDYVECPFCSEEIGVELPRLKNEEH
jgi:uncharacterized protein with PIN domain